MSTYFPKPGPVDIKSQPLNEPQTDERGRFVPGTKTSTFQYQYTSGRMYPIRFEVRFGFLHIVYDPRDVRNQPPNWGRSTAFTEEGRSTTPGEDASGICEGGAVCCADISCYNTGGCGGGLITEGEYYCNPFCQSYYDSYGENPDGCPEPFDSECKDCNELSDTITDKPATFEMSCHCSQAIPPTDCVVCNTGNGVWETSSLCRKKTPPSPRGECVCQRTGCSISKTTTVPWNGGTCASIIGYRNVGFLHASGSPNMTCLYCNINDNGSVVCTDSLTGELCCAEGASDECICYERNGKIECWKACSPDVRCNPTDDKTSCTYPAGPECSDCEVCDQTTLKCKPDPTCGGGCGSINTAGTTSRSCNCHSQCGTCELCNANGRCYPDPGCANCSPL